VGCGGLYTNPVVTSDCPDPGVLKDGDHYVMACTGGTLGAAFPLRTTKDLVHFTEAGHVLTGKGFGTWSIGDYWAREVHRIGTGYVAYYSARHVSGHLAVGAAVASSALGPYVDVGAPLVHEATVGHIDAHVFADEGGTHYLAWKDDGNAFGKPTPIVAQALGADGLTRVGPKVVLLVNDLPWEGGLVEGPWVVRHDGFYFLFYSANGFYDERYAVGVARSEAPLGPYVKLGPPILTTRGAWAGPGHGSFVPGPRGEDVFVHHAWRSEHVNEAPGRLVLVDRIQWTGGWPTLFGAPSSASRPLP
jgi:beta-xylosidase